MPLTQAFMDGLAATVKSVYGSASETTGGAFEPLTYWHRVTRSAGPTEYGPLDGLITEYSEAVITAQLALTAETTRIQREDRLLRLATLDVTWQPTLQDSITRSDGTVWLVKALAGGQGKPFWRMQLRRQVGN